MTKILTIVTLAALALTLFLDNRELRARNARIKVAVRAVVYNRDHRCLGYLETGESVKNIYVKKLTQ